MISNTMAVKICTGNPLQQFLCGAHGGQPAPGGGFLHLSQGGFDTTMLILIPVAIVLLVIGRVGAKG